MSGIRRNQHNVLIGLAFAAVLAAAVTTGAQAATSRATVLQPPRQGLADLIRKPVKKPELARTASQQDELPRPLSSAGLIR